jgi:hypothetical protein
LAVFGLQGNGGPPILAMRGPAWNESLTLMVSPESKPSLLMGDKHGLWLLLGIEQSDTHEPDDNNWGLLFGNSLVYQRERVRISMVSKKDGERYIVWGYSEVNRERVPQREQ